MKKLIILICLIALHSCKEGRVVDNTLSRTIDLPGFTIRASPDWKTYIRQGTDSQVGIITNERDTLYYDFGWYSYSFGDITTATHSKKNIIVDGRTALVVKPKNPGNGVIGFYAKIDGMNRLSLTGRSKNEAEILSIFESIKFK